MIIKGQYGTVGINGVTAGFANWSLDISASTEQWRASGTKGYQVTSIGKTEYPVSISGVGTYPPVLPGWEGEFNLYTGDGESFDGEGIRYHCRNMLCTNASIHLGYTDNTPHNWTLSFGYNASQNSTPPTKGTGVPPQGTLEYPVKSYANIYAWNGVEVDACIESIDLTLELQTSSTSSSCTNGATMLLRDGKTASASIVMQDAPETTVGDVGSVSFLDGGYVFNYMIQGGKSGFTLDIAGTGVSTYTLDLSYTPLIPGSVDGDGVITVNGTNW